VGGLRGCCVVDQGGDCEDEIERSAKQQFDFHHSLSRVMKVEAYAHEKARDLSGSRASK
jgi:hypothetical protein